MGRKGGTRSLPRSVLARVGIELLVPPTPSSLNIQASLLAMAVDLCASMQDVPPSSRASSLPQGLAVNVNFVALRHKEFEVDK
ncbi:hypothetical protein F7R20_21255 [Pseudomonas brassicacearum subsp. brassicacearum]|nr:hypothetical protein F7R20_21255 [Pseudomonas brassicacearum subsp. brassicacearum]QEO81870.1 hypothetical protein ELZ14_09005 [Pseudomonas brassicacearum]